MINNPYKARGWFVNPEVIPPNLHFYAVRIVWCIVPIVNPGKQGYLDMLSLGAPAALKAAVLVTNLKQVYSMPNSTGLRAKLVLAREPRCPISPSGASFE
jgi:hypothetical protein